MKQLCMIILLSLTLSADVVLQVLGSGGPESGDKRASSSYLIWIDGKAKIIVDFGGGAMLRYEESGAKIEDLEVILLTHLHIDHTADLPALFKASYFTSKSGELPIYGPKGNIYMPDTERFIHKLFENKFGAWEYMGDYLNGDAPLQLQPHDIPKSLEVKEIYKKESISIQTISVHHGTIPAQAYRIEVGNQSITFSGDMNGSYHTLEKVAKDTDILVAHNAVPKSASGVAAKLHMTPVTIGKIAYKAKVRHLVLSHRMLRTLGKEKETQYEIRRNYEGEVSYANDGDRYKIKRK